MKAKAGVPHRRGAGMWVQGLACGALVTLATPTAVLAAVLLLPAIIVFALDQTEGKPTTRAVALLGLATAMSPGLALWTGGHSMAVCLALLSDPVTIARAWAAQGGGWLLVQLLPLALRLLLERQSSAQMRRLRAERASLEEAWGIAPAPPEPSAPADAGAK
jgi:hypothetical protein